MEKYFFFGISGKIEKQITNRKKGVNGKNISWLNTRDIRIVKEAPFLIYTKGNFNDDAFVEVDISKRTRGRPDNFFTQSDINALWPNGKPIAGENLRDLKSIWHLISKDYLEFYSGLYADGTVEDDLGCYFLTYAKIFVFEYSYTNFFRMKNVFGILDAMR
ncbi:unnamed protein product [Psylliodes chrysocephalus]|uniref:Uncharacterized protein n=1 Tax=Psylliodes chrysocephalus TaxID=3402493 RepID=A0A9P0DCL4_9CUCU|nr:unnamed protein product [Psylliodes chrysocephala]